MSDAVSDDSWRTIDELARVSGVTVRNIRAYQSRGLLPPPQVRARTGYYGPDHEARLELIRDLQGEGVKLDTVKKLLDTTGGSTEQVVRFIRTVRAAFAGGERQIVTVAELGERFADTDAALLKRAQKAGLLREISEDQYEEISPSLVRAAAELHGLGIPPGRSMEVVEQLRTHADAIAKIYVELFIGEIWQPFDSSGRPEEGWPRLYETIEQLRRIGGEALGAVLRMAVSERLDVTFGRDLARTIQTSTPAPAPPASPGG